MSSLTTQNEENVDRPELTEPKKIIENLVPRYGAVPTIIP